ncbi:hypothetical protein [Brevundimonas sp.]|uniref:hypothetical protein n=1 Tax=Brevundimonas sp. TaxID=1871086 RepID=UPI003D10D790
MHHVFISNVAALLVRLSGQFFAYLAPRHLEGESGIIRPERWTAAMTVLIGLAFAVAGVAALFASQIALGLGAILIGLACAAFMAPSLTDIHSVHWSAEGVEGPCRLFGPTLGIKRTEIRWGEVVRVGNTITDYCFIETTDGRRVYWSYLYRGYGAFTDVLMTRCPWLEDSNEPPPQIERSEQYLPIDPTDRHSK